MRAAFKVHSDDNLLVALQDLKKGDVVSVDGIDYTLKEDIPAKHKFAAEQQQFPSEEAMLSTAIKRTFTGLIEANQYFDRKYSAKRQNPN